MPFTTQPFDLGNTFAKVAQVQALQSRNAFSEFQLQSAQDEQDLNERMNTFLTGGGDQNELPNRFGGPGLDLQSELVQLSRDKSQAGQERLALVLETGKAVNDAVNAAIVSANPLQSVEAALQKPVFGDAFKSLKEKIKLMSPEELMSSLKQLDIETDIFRSPQQVSSLVAGDAAVDLGFRDDTVLQVTKGGGKPDDIEVLQQPDRGPLVAIDQRGESAATKAFGGTVGVRAGDRADKAFATFADDANLTRLELALARGGRSGFGESVILDVRGALDTLGLADFPEGAQESEIIRSIGNVLALRMRNPDSGLGLTGNTSNRDLIFLKESVAGIGRSEGGNLLLIKMAKKLNEFKRAIAEEQSNIITDHGAVVPINLDALLMKFANNYQMFTESERKEISLFSDNVENKPAVISDTSNADLKRTLGLD